MAHERAGQVALPEDLIDVDALIGAYYDLVPNPDDPDQQVVFGTSGHRGSSLDAVAIAARSASSSPWWRITIASSSGSVSNAARCACVIGVRPGMSSSRKPLAVRKFSERGL